MEWLAPLGDSVVAKALIRSSTLYIFVNAGHILSLSMLLGASVILDLRLLGAFTRMPLAETVGILSRIAAVALTCAVLTGLALFSVRPLEYAANTAFRVKVLLVILGALNALQVHGSKDWKDLVAGGSASLKLRLAAMFSMIVWICAVVSGRWIGFL